MTQMTPQEIVHELDKHIVGQGKAKKAVAIAEKYCPVSNALKCPVHVTCGVEGK